jgi:hypothetical protein
MAMVGVVLMLGWLLVVAMLYYIMVLLLLHVQRKTRGGALSPLSPGRGDDNFFFLYFL